MKKTKKGFLANESGAVAVYVALGLVVLLGCTALAVDIAHMVSVKRELVKAAEAGALSGARALWPMALPVDNNVIVTPNCAYAENIARLAAEKNQVDGRNFTDDSEITVEAGRWDYATRVFTPGNNANANSIRVTTRRTNVPMIFAKIIGEHYRNMSASAIAVMDYATDIGNPCLPICVDQNAAFDSEGNVKNIDIMVHMTPDVNDNAGWFVVPPDSASASQLKDYVNNTDYCSTVAIDTIINLQNGADASVMAAINDKFIQCKDTDGTWTVSVPTVNTIKFLQNESVTNFVGLKITKVITTTNDKQVYGHLVKMAAVPKGLPGGGKGGVLAFPKLVQ
jgi:Flp pilus assembly protein TadG